MSDHFGTLRSKGLNYLGNSQAQTILIRKLLWEAKIFPNFQSETARIKAKFFKAGFPHMVIENTINNFNNVDEELMMPKWLFDKRKTVAINLSFSNKNELFQKSLARS